VTSVLPGRAAMRLAGPRGVDHREARPLIMPCRPGWVARAGSPGLGRPGPAAS